ncbi:LTA synthase family protein [Bifidobacterium longum]|uniref:LTA synthase family protein n=1 Tax=Bifidobacterium longum TaxID=216816 RepID=UPI0010A99A5A|nr:LTA synthase family protein [Bifidobacterium longum]QCH31280.1 LTA synthase family protein [Bifidobacterium longum]
MDDTQDNQEFTVEEADTNGTTSAESSQSSAHSDRDDNSQEAQKSKPSLPPIFQQIRAQLNTLMASQTMTALSKALTVLHSVFKKRPRFPYLLYIMVMAIVDSAAVLFIQWGTYTESTYTAPSTVDETTRLLNSIRGQLTRFVAQMWMEQKYIWLLNFCVLGMVYLVLIFVLNRFWVATALFAIITSVFAVANHIKIQLRNEPVIPSDLSFIFSGNGGEVASFIPKDSQALVNNTITMLVWLTIACLLLQFIDGRRCVISFHWRRPLRNTKTIIGNCTRIVAVIVSTSLLCSFTLNLNTVGSWSHNWAQALGDSPTLWDAAGDASLNGPTINFLRLANPKTMTKPSDYSQATMQEIAQRYNKIAEKTNQSRSNNLTDNTMIMILSESFSDPTRVPGITLSEDPMPNIRALKNTTTSGLMLSPGYGGGTANIEYQALTGWDLALFDNSMQVPYQQLVPHQKVTETFNQLWNDRYGASGSIAFHPYYKNMYLRDIDYKKFGFSHFYTLDSNPPITHHDGLDNSPYASDAEAYQNVVDELQNSNHPQFIQLATMQNHPPYSDWYSDNQFKDADTTNLPADEKTGVDTYIKGVSITDQATTDFLNQLDAIDQPITVIFYGDHLPGVYTTARASSKNTITMQETDYFIWSNEASASAGTKLDPAAAATSYTSPNYFMAMASDHMNTKVSAYIAFLSAMRAEIPATERLTLGVSGVTDNTPTVYLDANGNVVSKKELSSQQKKLLNDYRLIQYDMTAGKNYLSSTKFFDVK